MPQTRALVDYLRQCIERSGKNQSQIAAEAGLNSRQAVSMILNGAMKLPILRVRAFARAIGADETKLFRLVLAQLVGPEECEAMLVLARETALTDNQRAVLQELRRVSGEEDPVLDQRLKDALNRAYRPS